MIDYRGHVLAVLLAAVVCLAACSHTWTVESRETPTHVWLSAPDVATCGGSVNALIYVGAKKVVEGPVGFPRGTPHVVLPTVYTTCGSKQVSVVIDGGRLSACEQIRVGGESWVQVVVQGDRIQIFHSEQEPLCPPEGWSIPFPGS